ncbi:MAG TPA: glycosyltransferase family 4 protein [Fimbriiglobus sp.]|nr:glycosyltransferase family 4 protein [Fimbriiglobus sp.]
MRIAQVAPLYESVPPKFYGGTERVVSYLTEELVRQGHEVTLFASGDSVTRAELVPACPRALRLDETCVDRLAPHFVMLEKVFRQAHRFDVIHFHIDYLHYPLSRRQPVPNVTTLHGRLDLPELPALYDEYRDAAVVSISDAQRRPLPRANWQATVHHGLPDAYRCRERPGDYLAFLGRISPEKRVDRAVEIARRVGMKLKVAAKVDEVDRDYFRATIEPLFRDPLVEYVGEIGDRDKDEFLGNAHALLFPIDWPEPFGLVMIEAMACGTPVVAYRHGSVPEVIDDGETGFVVETVEDATLAVAKAGFLDRRRVREVFDERFSAERMASDYLAVYRHLITARSGVARVRAPSANGKARVREVSPGTAAVPAVLAPRVGSLPR